MVALRVALGDISDDCPVYSKIEQCEITYNGNGKHPDPVSKVSEAVEDEGREKEPHSHIRNRT